MTLKSRLAGLIAVLLICTVAPSAFAQVSVTIIPDIDNGDIQTNNNAIPAAPGSNGSGVLVVGSLIAQAPLTSTVLRIAYPGPITALASGALNCTIGGYKALNTNSGSGGAFQCNGGIGVPTADPIRIVGASGVFAMVGTATPLLNTTNQRIEILLPDITQGGGNNSSGSFRLVGVRINANGLTGAQTVTASLNTSVNNYLIGSPSSGTAINTLNPGIASFGIGIAPGFSTIAGAGSFGAGTATIFTNGNIARSQGSMLLVEGCASCWRTRTQNSNNGGLPAAVDNSTQIRVTFTGIPAGVTLNLTIPGGGAAGLIGTASSNSSLAATILSGSSVTTAAATAVIDFTGTSLTQIEQLEIDYTTIVSTGAAVSTPSSITATATMFPIGTGIANDVNLTSVTNVPTEASGYPSFTDLEVGPVTLVNIVPANTTMLMPLVEFVPPYDTGIAIANTTTDPFGSGTGGATKSAGTLTFTCYNTPATGTPTSFTLTTSSTNRPWPGFATDGTVPSGGTVSGLFSQLLTTAGQTGNFLGYCFIQANFLDAHGTATISDFRTYSLTANVLVLPPPATTPRTAPSGGAEQLHF